MVVGEVEGNNIDFLIIFDIIINIDSFINIDIIVNIIILIIFKNKFLNWYFHQFPLIFLSILNLFRFDIFINNW